MMRRLGQSIQVPTWTLASLLLATTCYAGDVGHPPRFEWSFSRCEATAIGSIVWSFAQDREGRLWLGSENGLMRHDGARVTSLADRFPWIRGAVSCIVPDRHGRLWIGHGGGLTCIEAASLQERPIPTDLPQVEVFSVHLRDEGRTVWVASAAGLFVSADGAAFVAIDLGAVPTTAFGMAWLNEKTAIVGTSGRLLLLMDRHVEQIELPAEDTARPAHEYRAVCVAPDGAVWVGCRRPGGLYRRTGVGWQRLGRALGLTNDDVNVIIIGPEGRPWIGTEHGVFRWTGREFEAYSTRNGMPKSDDVHGLYFTHEDQLWIGTFGAGAIRLDSQHVMNYDATHGLPHPFVMSLAQVGPDAACIGTGNGACVLGSGGRITPIPDRMRVVRTIHADETGAVWFGGNRGLFKLVDGELRLIADASDLNHAAVTSITRGPDDQLWLGTTIGLASLSRSDLQISEASALYPDYFVNRVLGDRAGTAWVATTRGLMHLRGGRVVQRHFEGQAVQVVARSPEGRLFAGVQERLLRFTGEAWRPVELPYGAGMVNDILVDRSSRIWVATTTGLARLGGRPTLLTIADGLAGNDIRCLCMDVAGCLLAGTTQGLSRIDIDRLAPTGVPPPVFIERAVCGSLDVERPTHVELPPAPGRIDVILTALSYRDPAGVTYSYRFAAGDAPWSPRRPNATLSFYGLSPGDHRLEVLAYDPNGTPSAEPAVMAIHVLPHFYQTTGFLIVVLLSSGGLVTLAVRVTRKRAERRQAAETERRLSSLHIEALEKERTEIARELHDELAQILAAAKMDAAWIGAHADGRVAERARAMDAHLSITMEKTRQLAARLPPSALTSLGLTAAIEGHLENFRKTTGVACQVFLEDVGIGALDDRVAAEAYRIVQEATTNIARHARATTMTVRLSIVRGNLQMEVSDDGVGLPPKQDRLTFGLAGMRHRAEGVGGTVTIDSEPGRGTRVRVTMPVKPVAR